MCTRTALAVLLAFVVATPSCRRSRSAPTTIDVRQRPIVFARSSGGRERLFVVPTDPPGHPVPIATPSDSSLNDWVDQPVAGNLLFRLHKYGNASEMDWYAVAQDNRSAAERLTEIRGFFFSHAIVDDRIVFNSLTGTQTALHSVPVDRARTPAVLLHAVQSDLASVRWYESRISVDGHLIYESKKAIWSVPADGREPPLRLSDPRAHVAKIHRYEHVEAIVGTRVVLREEDANGNTWFAVHDRKRPGRVVLTAVLPRNTITGGPVLAGHFLHVHDSRVSAPGESLWATPLDGSAPPFAISEARRDTRIGAMVHVPQTSRILFVENHVDDNGRVIRSHLQSVDLRAPTQRTRLTVDGGHTVGEIGRPFVSGDFVVFERKPSEFGVWFCRLGAASSERRLAPAIDVPHRLTRLLQRTWSRGKVTTSVHPGELVTAEGRFVLTALDADSSAPVANYWSARPTSGAVPDVLELSRSLEPRLGPNEVFPLAQRAGRLVYSRQRVLFSVDPLRAFSELRLTDGPVDSTEFGRVEKRPYRSVVFVHDGQLYATRADRPVHDRTVRQLTSFDAGLRVGKICSVDSRDVFFRVDGKDASSIYMARPDANEPAPVNVTRAHRARDWLLFRY